MEKDDDSLASGRNRRTKSDKHGRLAAFDKLKLLKGSKNKYELTEEKPVYEVVDEKAYSKIVQERQDEDWIEDDGSGYVEDGRDIFDEDIESSDNTASKKTSKGKSFKLPQSDKKSVKNPGRDIKSMFSAAVPKKKLEKTGKPNDDQILNDIMQEIHQGSSMIKPKLMRKKETSPSVKEVSSVRPLRPCNPFAKSPSNRPGPLNPPQTSKLEESSTRNPKRKSSESLAGSTRLARNGHKLIKTEPEENSIDEAIEKNDFTKIVQKDSENFDAAIDDIDDFDLPGEPIEDVPSIETAHLSPKKIECPETKTKNFIIKEKVQTETQNIVSQWDETITQTNEKANELDTSLIDTSELDNKTDGDDQKISRIFWLDAHEDYYKHPGTVFLFGKVWIKSAKRHVSCCAVVRNIERLVYLLPREKKLNAPEGGEAVTLADVYSEFTEEIAKKYNIGEFKIKTTTKKYAFEKGDVPTESEYLEVRYSTKYPALPSDLKGSSFSHVFGTNTSNLEQLLIEKKIKGPMWLDIKDAQFAASTISWCKVEFHVDDPKQISLSVDQTDKPNIVLMSLSVQTAVNPSNLQHEIVCIASCFHRNYPIFQSASSQHENYFCVISKPSNVIFPYDFKKKLSLQKDMQIEKVDSERSLLTYFLAKMNQIDPDIIVGHDLIGFYLDVLQHRLTVNNVPNWSKVGRLKRTVFPKKAGIGYRSNVEKTLLSGRLVGDVKISAQELIKAKSYDLPELVSEVLHTTYTPAKPEQIRAMYSISEEIISLTRSTLMESCLVLRILSELNIIPLALQITNIAGNLLGRTLLGGRSERNEFLLLHAFHEKNFICPDKSFGKMAHHKAYLAHEDEAGDLEVTQAAKGGGVPRKKAAYAGGLVLEPKKGLYDNYVLLMDFNSLYPSIIQEYNICFTTVKRYEMQTDENGNEPLAMIPDAGQEMGILPAEIHKLVESRRNVKDLMKGVDVTPEQMVQFDIRQKALKLTANSMYGCLGFTNSRFYAKPLAALITSKGREILMNTKSLVEKMSLEVIYGDTDSIMINTNSRDYEEVLELGQKVKKEVNKFYRLLELEVDGVFKTMLLLKKKKYAAIVISKSKDGKLIYTTERKGLDIVRRDWSDLAKKAGSFVIDQLLSELPKDEILEAVYNHMEEIGNQISAGQIPLDDYVINKQLTKNPENYPDKNSLPHVLVAMRMNKTMGKRIKQGDTVPYVICEDGTSEAAIRRAYHPDEIKSSETLNIDTKYYKGSQVLPVVSRVCEPIDGLSMSALAGKLGLEPSAFVQTAKTTENSFYLESADHDFTAYYSYEDRFEFCHPWVFDCPAENCGQEITITQTFDSSDPTNFQCSFEKCPHCETELVKFESDLRETLAYSIRSYVQNYYQSWYICDDISCQYRTNKMTQRYSREGPVCPSCCKSTLFQEYNSTKLYNQLMYFRHILDFEKKLINFKNDDDIKDSSHVTLMLSQTRLLDFSQNLIGIVDDTLSQNKYGQVDLGKIFEEFIKPNIMVAHKSSGLELGQ